MKNDIHAALSFRRTRLADQAAATLRDAIQRGVWRGRLPGGHELARILGISRNSVHAALSELAKEGLLAISKGRRSLVLQARRPSIGPPIACVVRSLARDTAKLIEHPVLLAMETKLALRKVGWEEICDVRLNDANPGPRLEKLTAGRRNVCWVLLGISAPAQRWFYSSGLPTLVLGSCYHGVQLPSIDHDYSAIGCHVASCLARFNHRHIVLVHPPDGMPGDIMFRDALVRGLRKIDEPPLIVEVYAGSNAIQLQGRLARVLAERPRPTAIIAMRPEHTQTVLVHLLRSGLRIPGDISLVSRDSEKLFEIGSPEITRYRSMEVKLGCRAADLVRGLLSGRPVPHRPILLVPAFVPGNTLGRRRL